MRDLAKHLGVSHATVSMAMRDSPRISPEMKAKVRREAEVLGYRPDPMLAALNSYRLAKGEARVSAGLAWVNAWAEPERLRSLREFDLYWQGAEAAALKFGYRLEEFRVGPACSPKRLDQILSARSIQGILLPPQAPHPDWGDFPWERYSVVRFGRSLKTPRCHVVTADQSANAALAFRKMLERGYRRIGFATAEHRISERGHLFLAGFLLAQSGLPEKERLPALMLPDAISRGEKAVRRGCVGMFSSWVERHRPDAILTDIADFRALMEEAGLEVPGPIGLAVTSILDANADSGIDQHAPEIGRVGFLMLNSLINDRSMGIPPIFRQILVEGSWVDGTTLPVKE